MAAGAFIPGMAPLAGAALGGMLGSGASGLFGGGGDAQPVGDLGSPPPQQHPFGGAPDLDEAPDNPFDQWGLKEKPVFAPQPAAQAPGSGADKGALIQMGLQQAAYMDERKREQELVESVRAGKLAEASSLMYPFRSPGAAPIVGVSPGQYQGVGGGFAFNR
jgi:hypothetical protein